MEDHHKLKLELSAILLAENNEIKEVMHYENRLKDLFNSKYSFDLIEKTLDELIKFVKDVELNIHLIEEYEKNNLSVYPDQFYEGN